MTRCANPTIKDLLPDLLHSRLAVAQRAEVEAHVSACADCRSELTILRRIVAVSTTPRIDVDRVASALPRYQAPSAWQRIAHSTQLKIAAAIVVLAGGAAVVSTMMHRDVNPTRVVVHTPALADSNVRVKPITPRATSGATTTALSQAKDRNRGTTELALGETLHDLSDDELRALLNELGTLEAVTPTETEVVAPALGRGNQ